MIDTKQIQLFRSLFKGRENVFALRWEKGNKKGYMPAYSYDPYMYRLHKQRGGTFKEYNDKTLLPLNDQQLQKHFSGEQAIGIYPLLQDNNSWFIVADFDKKDWKDKCQQAIGACNQNGIPAYLERSRSGNGGHIWIFFDKPYPASKSRKILLAIFEEAGVFSVFDKNTSFDRLFPNQDYLSAKGLGNLIALPLQGSALQQGNSCFIDPETFIPYPDQWGFLREISKIAISHLDQLHSKLQIVKAAKKEPANKSIGSEKLQIILKNSIIIHRHDLPHELINFLKEQLNFYNADFAVKKKMGRSTWKTERYFKLIEEKGDAIEIPRGFIGKLMRFCKQHTIDYDFVDKRKKLNPIEVLANIQLLQHQLPAIQNASKKDFGIIVAPPGSGKTIISLKIIAQKKQPALIITHRKQIAKQWIARIETFFGIPKVTIHPFIMLCSAYFEIS